MASPASKFVPADVSAAIAAFEAKNKIEKLPAEVAQNLKKTKYVGRKALAGATQRLGFIPSAYSA
jgi:hypothetical protein